MKKKTAIAAVSASALLVLCLLLFSTKDSDRTAALDRNVEALTSGRAFKLGPCYFPTAGSGVKDFYYFCAENTSERTLSNCIVDFAVSSEESLKCVESVQSL